MIKLLVLSSVALLSLVYPNWASASEHTASTAVKVAFSGSNDNAQIIVMSEFGRTAHENGNGGTDHGHGNVIWLMGGGTPGGKVYARWSGLKNAGLYESRDLAATTDFRSVLCAVVGEHMGLSSTALSTIFPDFQYTTNPFVRA